ncbi:MAG: branched-chain amino acid ABC transporter permease [Lentisphaeria bacterium]|nr:branched-chain amino acid ABC transporter permease [Lentisphaeria bacterium]
MRDRSPMMGIAVLALLVLAAQLAARALGREYYLTQLTMAAYYTMVVMGLCLVMGYAGQISLGHGAFFAIGGYTTAILTTRDLGQTLSPGTRELLLRLHLLTARTDLYGTHLTSISPGIACVAALLLAAAVACAVGYPTLRLKGHYLAMGTLGFGLIVYRLLLGTEFAGGADGIVSVPPLSIAGPLRITGARDHRVVNYYIAWGLALVLLTTIVNITNSRVGRALKSIHAGETAANAMGINTAGYKLKAFILSAVVAALAGSCFTHYNGGIDPSEAGVMKSVRYVALVAAGGMANAWGALIVGASLTFLSLRGCFGSFDHAVFGILLIAIMSLAPDGPLRPLGRLLQRPFRRRRSANPSAPQSSPGH